MISTVLGWLARFSTVGVAVVLGACSGSTEAQPAGPSSPSLDAEESAMVQAVNDLRGMNGAQMLKDCATLNISASKHSDDMRDQGYLADVAPDGSTPRSRACDAGYQSACGSTAMAELVASGIYEAEGALSQWTKKAETLELLNRAELAVIGVGRADGGESPVWTLDFGGAYEPSCDQAPAE